MEPIKPNELEKARRELAELRQKRILGSLPDGAPIRKKRREIARILTHSAGSGSTLSKQRAPNGLTKVRDKLNAKETA